MAFFHSANKLLKGIFSSKNISTGMCIRYNGDCSAQSDSRLVQLFDGILLFGGKLAKLSLRIAAFLVC